MATGAASQTPRQRFLAALSGTRPSLAPASVASPTSIVTLELQQRTGAFFPEAHRDPALIAKLALAGHTICGYDVVFPVFGGGTHEAEAFGAPVEWRDQHNLPVVRSSIWKHPDEADIPKDFLDRPAIRSVIEAIRILRAEVGDRVGIIGKVYGPWSLAYHMFGVQRFLLATARDPEAVDAMLARLKAATVLFGRAQIEAGADALTLGDHITANLVRPDAYPRFLLGLHRELVRELPVPMIFHCCGKTSDRIGYFNDSGVAAFHFDSANDARDMRAKARMVLIGNINNVLTLLEGGPEDVRWEVFHALDAGIEIIAPECAVPVGAKLANIVAVRDAVENYYRHR
ncbi:MAG: MtaA/CmuA family methyltransferase [Alphaproteobacteria bacterium]|nr:MtaA/CmuA family methyltransferase [Alphaproteobacteria bacterium]